MDYTNELIPYTSVDYYRENLKSDEVVIEFCQLEQETPPSSHDNVLFMYATAGEAVLEINGQSIPFKKGQLILVMSYHIFKLKPISQVGFSYYQCQFSIGLLLLSNTSKSTYHESLSELDRDIPLVSLLPEEQIEMDQLCKKLLNQQADALPWANDLRILSAITSVVYLFLTSLVRREEKKQAPMNSPWQLLQYLHFHHQKNLTLEDLAAEFQLTPADVSLQLKQLTKLSFAQNLNRVRIINATALLEFNALSVNQIGRIVGFQSDAYFYREFKKVHQQTPQAYRNSFFPQDGTWVEDDSYDIYMYIYENYRQSLTIEKIAKALSITPKRVTQLVTNNFQLTVTELVTRLRCTSARGLMLSTDLPLNQISEAVGFNDAKQFRRYFSAYYHQTPKKYRESCRQTFPN